MGGPGLEDRATSIAFRQLRGTRQSKLDLLATARVARLATVRPSGQPHIVPITFVVDRAAILTMVDQKPKSTSQLIRLDNIDANREVSVLADHYDDRWSELWWVRADGNATLHDADETWRRAQTLLVDKYPQYAADPPAGTAIAIEVKNLTSWEW